MYKIEKCKITDLNSVAKIHKNIFPDHFLGTFPISLIYKFYLEYFKDKNVIFLCGKNEKDEVVGFVMGGVELENIKRRFIKNNIVNFVICLITSFKSLKLLPNSFKSLMKRKNNDLEERVQIPEFRLLSIGTLPNERGTGLAKQLVEQYEKNIRLRFPHFHEYGLSVHSTNIGARKFYNKMGFVDNEVKDNVSIFLKKELN